MRRRLCGRGLVRLAAHQSRQEKARLKPLVRCASGVAPSSRHSSCDTQCTAASPASGGGDLSATKPQQPSRAAWCSAASSCVAKFSVASGEAPVAAHLPALNRLGHALGEQHHALGRRLLSRRRLGSRAALLGPRVHLRRESWPERTLLQRREQSTRLAAGASPALEASQAHAASAFLRAQTAAFQRLATRCPTFWSPRDRNERTAMLRCTTLYVVPPVSSSDNEQRLRGCHVADCNLRVLPAPCRRPGSWLLRACRRHRSSCCTLLSRARCSAAPGGRAARTARRHGRQCRCACRVEPAQAASVR